MCSFYLQLPHFFSITESSFAKYTQVEHYVKHCGMQHLKKTRLLPNLKPSQNVLKHSVFKLCKFDEKINGQFFARGQNLLYNT